MSQSRSPEREAQRRRSVGEGNLNLGSNRNAEGKREVSNRERVGHIVVEAHGATKIDYTPDQHGSRTIGRDFCSRFASNER